MKTLSKLNNVSIVAASSLLVFSLIGCQSGQAEKPKEQPKKDAPKVEYLNPSDVESLVKDEQLASIQSAYKAKWKAEEAQAKKEKAEKEAKAKAEEEAEEQQNTKQTKEEQANTNDPVSLAKWECQNYKDIHDRFNNSTMGNQFGEDDYYNYLKTIENQRSELLGSGELQWITAYEQGYLHDDESQVEEPAQSEDAEEPEQNEVEENEQTFDEYMEEEQEKEENGEVDYSESDEFFEEEGAETNEE